MEPLPIPVRPSGGRGGSGSRLPSGGGTNSLPELRIGGNPDAYLLSNISSS